MAYAAFAHGGSLPLPVDLPLAVMYGFTLFNLLKYITAVPLLYKYRLGRQLASIALLYYAAYNIVYVLAVAGVLG
jgi:hypothetical protein